MSNYSTPSTYSIVAALVKDPVLETFKTKEGKTIRRLRLTVADSTKSERHVTLWPEFCVEDDKRIEYFQLMKKGDVLHGEGKPELRVFLKKDGTPGVSLEIRYPRVLESITYLGDRKAKAAEEPDAPADDSPANPYLVTP